MSIVSTPIINTVTLQPGEQFILPPNATLLATSDAGSLTSTCDIPELEEYACYVFVLSVPGQEGGETQFGEAEHTHIIGYEMDGRLYQVPNGDFAAQVNGDGNFDTSLLLQALRGIANSGYIITDCVSGFAGEGEEYSNPTDRGAITYIVFRTIPSIAAKIKLKISVDAPIGGQSTVFYYISPQLRTAAESFGYLGMCECETPEQI